MGFTENRSGQILKVEIREKDRKNDYGIFVNGMRIGRIYEGGIMLHCDIVDMVMNKDTVFFSGIQIHNEGHIAHDDEDGWTSFIKPKKDDDDDDDEGEI